ncbi:NUDIX domain-containing protein [Niabella yanshanensis]|uniref:NUDIX domain-containing protein n=1 Tax=Niabella yanshanensis TaxID=577386 RepID=A0ABZ0W6C5_9BACT|nr:NUDIX domain-containing protein [Niabella yanshanensis]WQD38853.1 NUDIX domain-containing protein [Niabella yanshanensis]
MINTINLRVYGVLVNDKKQVLVSDERIYYNNLEVTKFPGGGLELGEGTRDCVIRECKEEIGIDVEVVDHIYTTDFFQQSAFNPEHQIVSVYYLIRPLEALDLPVNNGDAIYPEQVSEIFRFVDWEYFNEGVMTLPIDKVVAKLLREKY